jgi:hypothetical protein
MDPISVFWAMVLVDRISRPSNAPCRIFDFIDSPSLRNEFIKQPESRY